jgi:hypothetical protein
MPLYDIKCSEGHVTEVFIPLEKFDRPVICGCNAPAERLISAPMFTVDSTAYTCPITGDWIASKHQHRENLAKHGCRVLETGEKELAAQRRIEADARLDKTIEDHVEREFEALPSAKKETLSNELLNGKLDLAVTRESV